MAGPEPAERAQGNAPWPLDGPIERSPWRGVAAVGAVGEAVAHIPVIQMHLTEAPYLGGAFVLLTVAGFLLGLLLLTADTPRVWLVTGAIAAMALAGYVISRTIGLPEITDDIGNWTEPLGLVAIGAETLMLAGAILHDACHLPRQLRHHPDRDLRGRVTA